MRLNTFALIAVMMMWPSLASAQEVAPVPGVPNMDVTGPPELDAAEERALGFDCEGMDFNAFRRALVADARQAGVAAPSTPESRSLFREIDTNSNGGIDADEAGASTCFRAEYDHY